ncbi:MAG: cryptochrome/photolyase family protein [Candidatus Amoebophilus sp.]
MEQQPIILVFYQNLRFHDQPLLLEALQHTQPIIPIFINDPKVIEQLGEASQWWLYQSIRAFKQQWKSVYNIELILRTGDSVRVLEQLLQETNANKIYLGKRYTRLERETDERIYKELNRDGITIKFFNTHLLFEPANIKNQQGNSFQIFTPFWKTCLTKTIEADLPAPDHIFNGYNQPINSDDLSDWKWGHSQAAWTRKLANHCHPSELAALNKLAIFLKNSLAGYNNNRDLIAPPSFSSQLSPYLRWGQISAKKIFNEVIHAMERDSTIQQDGNTFLKEIGWREFSYYLLYHHPSMQEVPLNKRFQDFPYENNLTLLEKWQKGTTGFPIIDAGMRQLWLEGWMPNRLRMIVASFLIKDLLINWQFGQAWFIDTLVDADPANNANSWQWVAGCGTDAAPYFRIFNPITQGKKFDSEGKYIRKYVPELKDLPTKYIHQPWEMPITLQEEYNVVIGKDYPHPIVDHTIQKNKALDCWKEFKK